MNIQDLPKLLSYGSIIQLKDKENKYENILFFVNNISNFNLSLISNKGLDELNLEINEDGRLTNDNIIEVVILFQPNEGYCKLNGLLPNKFIKIIFNDASEISGKIINLEEDMIIVETFEKEKNTFYIDFEYSGINKDLNIKEIILISEETVNNNINNFEVLNSEIESDNNDILIYNLDQQIDDYIEKMFRFKKNKKVIDNEIYKYIQLLDKYTDLNKGIKRIGLSNNQVLNSFLDLNPNFMIPVTSYIIKEIYTTEEEIPEMSNFLELQNIFVSDKTEINDYGVKISTPSEIYETIKEINQTNNGNEIFLNNLTTYFQKKQPYHKKIKLNKDTKSLLINYSDEHENLTSTTISEGKINDIATNFENLQKDKSIVINGVLIHKLNNIKKFENLQHSQPLLTKTIQNIHNHVNYDNFEFKVLNNKIRYDKKSKINNKKYLYYPLLEEDKKFKGFISKMNYNLEIIYKNIYDRNELNFYDFFKKISMLDIYELNDIEYVFIQKIIKQNVEQLKFELNKVKRELLKIKTNKYKYLPTDNIYDLIIQKYNIINKDDVHGSELMNHAYLDSCDLLMLHFRMTNNSLTIPIDELNMDELIVKLQNEAEQLMNKEITNTIRIVKTYPDEKSMYKDTNKIVLKDVEGMNGIQFLHNHLLSNFNYTESIEIFVDKLNILLEKHKPETSDKTALEELRKELFSELGNEDSKNIFYNLIQKVIEIRVRKNEKCKVLNNDKIYNYDGYAWIPYDKSKETVKKRKVLKIKNSVEEFTQIKENIINDYILDQIEQIQNETLMKHEKSQIYDSTILSNILNEIVRIKNINRKNIHYKYNNQRLELEEAFIQSKYIENIKISKFLPLFHLILNLEDLNKKYVLLQKFIKNFTFENNDPNWFYCITSETKLVPKYLQRLAMAYLTYDNYDETIKEICLKEGTLSDSGDAWIHKHSGYVIQNIDFDTNYGYDENGFKIKMDGIPEENAFDEELIENERTIITQGINDEFEIKKEIILNKSEKEVQHLTLSLMKIIGITFKKDDNNNMLFKEINNIYENALKDKQENLKFIDKTKTYSILGFLLAYVQSKNIYIKKTFPGCNTNFDGYPLSPEERKDGIIYLSCILEKISKKNPNKPYYHFSKLNRDVITDELFDFIKTYTIRNSFVSNLLQNKRITILKEIAEDKQKEEYLELIKNPENFKPSLYELALPELDEYKQINIAKNKSYLAILNNQYYLNFLNTKIEEKIQTFIKKENAPILKTSFNEPYLVNYCCQNSEFILEHICRNKADHDELKGLLENSKDTEEILTNIHNSYLKNQLLNIKKDPYSNHDLYSNEYSENTIYLFIIYVSNFDNKKPIPEFMSEIVSEKPREFYNPKDDIKDKIIKLKENGFNYTINDFKKALQNKHLQDNIIKLEEQIQQKTVDNETYQKFMEKFSGNISTASDQFELSITKYLSSYEAYISSNISTELYILEKINTIINNFDTETNFEYKQLYVSFLYNLNYALICIIPQYFLYNKISSSTIICKHWNFAEQHFNDIKDNYKSYYMFFEKIELNDKYNEIFINIHSYKDILLCDEFKENIIVQYSFMKYLLYKCFSIYSLELQKSQLSGDDFTKRNEFNSSLLLFINSLIRKSNFNYEGIKTKVYNIKQSEKKIKTDFLKDMTRKQRDVEKSKMALKLGEWSYGNDQRVFKYYKNLYESEKETAIEIHNMMSSMYGDETSENHSYEGQNVEGTEDDEIYNEQTDDPRMLLNEEGEYMDEYEEENEY